MAKTVKEVVETAEKVEKEVVETVTEKVEEVVEKVKVELKNASEGFHTVFMKKGRVDFKDGVAEVEKTVAAELKDTGVVK